VRLFILCTNVTIVFNFYSLDLDNSVLCICQLLINEHDDDDDDDDTCFNKLFDTLNRVISTAQKYQALFSFPFFNIVQSQVLDDVSCFLLYFVYTSY